MDRVEREQLRVKLRAGERLRHDECCHLLDAIDAAERERDAARAEAERARRERDEARAALRDILRSGETPGVSTLTPLRREPRPNGVEGLTMDDRDTAVGRALLARGWENSGEAWHSPAGACGYSIDEAAAEQFRRDAEAAEAPKGRTVRVRAAWVAAANRVAVYGASDEDDAHNMADARSVAGPGVTRVGFAVLDIPIPIPDPVDVVGRVETEK